MFKDKVKERSSSMTISNKKMKLKFKKDVWIDYINICFKTQGNNEKLVRI